MMWGTARAALVLRDSLKAEEKRLKFTKPILTKPSSELYHSSARSAYSPCKQNIKDATRAIRHTRQLSHHIWLRSQLLLS
jgi:hypothetical protein